MFQDCGCGESGQDSRRCDSTVSGGPVTQTPNMKYFTAKENGKEKIIGSASTAKRYLRAHPEVQEVTRYWWSGNDLIECEDYDREKLLVKTVRELNSGATAQWCVHHGVR
jgi:hypothetical protein